MDFLHQQSTSTAIISVSIVIDHCGFVINLVSAEKFCQVDAVFEEQKSK